MLRYNLNRMFKIKFIEHPYSYLCRNGFTKSESWRYVSSQNPNIPLAKVEKLCVLFNCTPDDLMEWKPSGSGDKREDHPLNYLRKDQKSVDFRNLIEKLPPADIINLNDEILKKRNRSV